MKIKYILILICSLLLSFSLIAEEVTPLKKLFEESEKYEGRQITVQGEVIGDIMRDGNDYWLNIKEGDFFLGIVLGREEKEKITRTGSYRTTGDIIKITGVYNIHCAQHLGDRDIHAETVEILFGGISIEERIHTDRIIASIALGLLTILTLLYSFRKNCRKDNDDSQK